MKTYGILFCFYSFIGVVYFSYFVHFCLGTLVVLTLPLSRTLFTLFGWFAVLKCSTFALLCFPALIVTDSAVCLTGPTADVTLSCLFHLQTTRI